MTCKDCIHYTAHKHFYFGEEDFDEYFNDDNVESQCPEFEDKKEWLKLPCKVGDTVYQFGTDGKIYESQIQKIYYDTSSGITFDETAIGKSIFLAKEAAEKALAERSGK